MNPKERKRVSETLRAIKAAEVARQAALERKRPGYRLGRKMNRIEDMV